MTRCNLHKITRLIRTITRDCMEEIVLVELKPHLYFNFLKGKNGTMIEWR